MLVACPIVTEAVRLDVGRGVAVIDHEVRVHALAPCTVDFGASLLAREEGRGPPSRIAFRIDVDGALVVLGGPLGAASIDVEPGVHRVRVRAAMRGERFVAAPISTDPSTRDSTSTEMPIFSVRATSVWGSRGIAGVARWVDVGVPIVVQIDPARDHEPLSLDVRVGGAPEVVVVDGGPMLDASSKGSSDEDRARDLAAGGARALSVLLDDLPLAVATAPDDWTSILRLREAARAALAACRSRDPLTVAVGQRLTTAIASGFTTCQRDATTIVPSTWPKTPEPLVRGGLLDDAESGCPRVAGLLAADHPKLVVARESLDALEAAVTDPRSVVVAPVERARAPMGSPLHRFRHGKFRWILASALALLVAWLVVRRVRAA